MGRALGPQAGDDASGGPWGSQAGWPALVPALLIGVGWALLTFADGGIDLGGLVVGPGSTGGFAAVATAALLAAWCAWRSRRSPAWRSRPALLALAGAAGLTAWSALSIVWASAPDLAWLEANRAALALACLALGLALSATGPLTPERLAVGAAVAAAPALAWALGTKLAPTVLGAEDDASRLAEPIGYANALALVAAFAIPGALWLGGRPGAGRGALAGSAAAVTAIVLVLLMSYSRSGLVAAVVCAGVAVGLSPLGRRALVAVVAGVAGAVLPASHALSAAGLTNDDALAEARRSAGLGLGWRLVVGLAIAGGLAPLLDRLPPPAWRPRLPDGVSAGRATLAGLGSLVAAAAVVLAVSAGARGWVGDRLDSDAGLTNTSNRLPSLDANHRIDWWGESLAGFADSPLLGHGAGSFPLTHLAEREGHTLVRQPHQLTLQLLTELGILGLAFLVALVAGVVWAGVRARRAGAGAEIGLPLAMGAAFLVQSQLDWTWTVPALMVPALVAAGVVLHAAAPAGRRARSWPAWSAGLLIAVALLTGVSASLPWASAREVGQAYDLAAKRDLRAAFGKADLAESHNPLSIEPLVLRRLLLTAAGDLAGAVAVAERATRLQPENPRAWRTLVQALDRAGEADRAAAARARVAALDPLGPKP